MLVRHTYDKWFNATDSLKGTANYGNMSGPLSVNEFAISFKAANKTQFRFSFGICDKWLITTYDQFAFAWGTGYNAIILSSHISNVSYTAIWHNRGNSPEDPWISYKNHSDENWGTILYGENNYGGRDTYSGQYVNVWMQIETNNPTLAPTNLPIAPSYDSIYK